MSRAEIREYLMFNFIRMILKLFPTPCDDANVEDVKSE